MLNPDDLGPSATTIIIIINQHRAPVLFRCIVPLTSLLSPPPHPGPGRRPLVRTITSGLCSLAAAWHRGGIDKRSASHPERASSSVADGAGVKLRPMLKKGVTGGSHSMYKSGAVQRPIFELVKSGPLQAAHPGLEQGRFAWFVRVCRRAYSGCLTVPAVCEHAEW